MSGKKKAELTPADPERCQAEEKEGSFMTLGPRSWHRCDAKPTVIIAEVQPGADGLKGEMSLCEKHYDVFKGQAKGVFQARPVP